MNRAKAAFLGVGGSMAVDPSDQLHYYRFDAVSASWAVLVATNPVPVPVQTSIFDAAVEPMKIYIEVVPFCKEVEMPPNYCLFGAQETPEGLCCVIGPKAFMEK